jgi:hypothetical protein
VALLGQDFTDNVLDPLDVVQDTQSNASIPDSQEASSFSKGIRLGVKEKEWQKLRSVSKKSFETS